jgi:hypothetical protein
MRHYSGSALIVINIPGAETTARALLQMLMTINASRSQAWHD